MKRANQSPQGRTNLSRTHAGAWKPSSPKRSGTTEFITHIHSRAVSLMPSCTQGSDDVCGRPSAPITCPCPNFASDGQSSLLFASAAVPAARTTSKSWKELRETRCNAQSAAAISRGWNSEKRGTTTPMKSRNSGGAGSRRTSAIISRTKTSSKGCNRPAPLSYKFFTPIRSREGCKARQDIMDRNSTTTSEALSSPNPRPRQRREARSIQRCTVS
mmetsp:Transcript_111039/g.309207  ORF Transcript_111039/g.309207 Transcript_111039/m.309207 type:complete len:216 (-) Transcript_111039:164-811(-)